MANYIIIGGDKKEYGPITDSDIHQWVAEGRLNGQTMAKGEGEPEWRTLAAFPEFADLFAVHAPAAMVPPAPSTPADWAARDYDLDIGGCISRGWEVVKNNFWPAIGTTALVLVTILIVNQITGLFTSTAVKTMMIDHQVSASGIFLIVFVSILSAPVYVILTGGLVKYYLKLVRGQPAGIADAFSGFGPATGQLILLGVVMNVLTLIGYALCFLPGIYLATAWFFAMPLVMDRGMNFWEAMELSRKMVNKHWFLVFAFLLVFGLLSLSGIFACCVGIFVTLPIGYAALMVAYENIFSDPKAR